MGNGPQWRGSSPGVYSRRLSPHPLLRKEPHVRATADYSGRIDAAAFSGVIAALKENNTELREFPGPILCGIIAWPELSQQREILGSAVEQRGSG